MNVILYSTGCPKCRVLKKKLEINNISFDVNESVEEMQSMGFQELPQLSVDGKIYNFIEALNWIAENEEEE